MKGKPIIFRVETVVDILSGSKVGTTRPLKSQPPEEFEYVGEKQGVFIWLRKEPTKEVFKIESPYGSPGDRLWVKEAWAEEGGTYYYKATKEGLDESRKYRSPLMMPREAARLFLEITEISVKRVQCLTPQDILAEGIFTEDTMEEFPMFWDSMYRSKGREYQLNPWVYNVRYKIVGEG